MKKRIAWTFGLAAVIAAGVLVGQTQSREHKAFTVVSQTVETSPDGQRRAWKIDTDTYFPDGSSVHVANSYDGEALGWRQILDLKAHKRITVDPDTHSITTYPLTANAVGLHQRLNKCEGAPGGKLLGYVVLRQSKTIGGAFKTTDDMLVAPELDCFPLKIDRSMRDPDGKVMGRQVVTVTQVIAGDNNRSAMVLEPGYVERSPSAVRAIEAGKTGIKCTTCEQNSFTKLDQAYRQAQANR
jgi:hypothetical protein